MIFIKCLGIDISKSESVVAHYKDEVLVKEMVIQNNQNGYRYLKNYIDINSALKMWVYEDFRMASA
ncbi:hypothetical protein NO88_02695 [Staphylococcus pseudintermedius]|nr:hypothetical protein [Staphylococcus pseudintermedius]KZK24348.1 hypothetical protein NO88_02695 [Staphylococcus pseudintermedius]